jgi:Fe-S cluster assembly protein SufB
MAFDLDLSKYSLGWSDTVEYAFTPEKGLSPSVVEQISWWKGEPAWMTKLRLRSLGIFERKPMAPWFAENMPDLDFQDIYYYLKPATAQVDEWDDLPEQMKATYEKLGIPEAERKYLAGVTAQFECLRGSTKVWTTRGMTCISEIQPGDEVFALDEERKTLEVAKVLQSARSGKKKIYEIRAGSRCIGASANHPFLVLRDYRREGSKKALYKTEWVSVRDLRVGDLVAVAKHLPEYGTPATLDEEHVHTAAGLTSDDLAWFCGLWLGDGYFKNSSGYRTAQIAVDASDEGLVDEIIRVCREQFGLDFRLSSDRYRLTALRTSAMANFLHANGLGGKSLTKRVPRWVFGLPSSQRRAFLAGFIDADGAVRANHSAKSPVITSANEPLLNDVRDLAQLCGVGVSQASAFKSRHSIDRDRIMTGYRLHLSGSFDSIPLRSPKKAGRLNKRRYHHTNSTAKGTCFRNHTSDAFGFVRIESITCVGEDITYDIEVAGHHNFVAEGFVVHNSEVVFHRNRADLEAQGILFCDMDTALREYPELVKRYFGTVIPPGDNKFAALNTAVWSGGSFIYVPPGVECAMPLQAYFRINAENAGQFERTLIIADEGSKVHYIEGCLLKGALVDLGGGEQREIEALLPGDLVANEHGGLSRIAAVSTRDYTGDVVHLRTLSPENGVTATVEHPVLAIRRRDVLTGRKPRNGWKPEVSTAKLQQAQPEFVPAGELEPGDFIVYAKPAVTLQPVVSDDFMRLAGYYLAEGSAQVINGCKALTFSFHIDEVEYAAEVQDLCERLWGKRGSITRTPSRNSLTVTVYTNAGYEAMHANVGTRSWSKKLSPLLFNQDEPALTALVDAYVNGDGNRARRGSRTQVRCHTTSRSWAMQLQAILARLGIFATVRLERPAGPGEILGRSVNRHALYLVQWTAGKRHSEVRESGRWFLLPIRSIERTPHDGPVFNLHCTPSESYLVDGIAVHNCSAPVYTSDSLHSAVVEIIVKPSARVTYTTIQNWSPNVYNLVTKRARVEAEGHMEWIDGNIGSRLTMKYPSVYLVGPKATGEVLSVAYAGAGQHQDAGAKMVHAAPETTSKIVSKSISKDGGITTYRGLVRVDEGAHGCKSHVQCDALILDADSESRTLPYIEVAERDAEIGHEATVSKIADEQLFYLMSRGLSQEQAMSMVVNGFIEPVTRTLPMEYAVEWSRLIELQMDGSVG